MTIILHKRTIQCCLVFTCYHDLQVKKVVYGSGHKKEWCRNISYLVFEEDGRVWEVNFRTEESQYLLTDWWQMMARWLCVTNAEGVPVSSWRRETVRAQVSCAVQIVGLFIDDNILVDIMVMIDGVWWSNQSHLYQMQPCISCWFSHNFLSRQKDVCDQV